eukprot:7586881-Pyramimonas_sp.AAC.1
MAAASVACSWSRNNAAVPLVLGCAAFLRAMELPGLRRCRLRFMVIALPVTKSDVRQHCEESLALRDPRLVRIVHILIHRVPPDELIL